MLFPYLVGNGGDSSRRVIVLSSGITDWSVSAVNTKRCWSQFTPDHSSPQITVHSRSHTFFIWHVIILYFPFLTCLPIDLVHYIFEYRLIRNVRVFAILAMCPAHIKLLGLITVPKLYEVYETSKIVVMQKSFKHENFKCFPSILLSRSYYLILYDRLLGYDGATLNSIDPYSGVNHFQTRIFWFKFFWILYSFRRDSTV